MTVNWTKKPDGSWAKVTLAKSSARTLKLNPKSVTRITKNPPQTPVAASHQRRFPRFNPSKETLSVHREEIMEFLAKDITGFIMEVPGVDDIIGESIREYGIDSSFALIGKFLSFREANPNSIEEMAKCCVRFTRFLFSEFGIEDEERLAAITTSIGMKANNGVAGAFTFSTFQLGLK